MTLPKDFRLGVLFVHGIGEQRRGDTLVNFGEAIQSWLRHWITRRESLSEDSRLAAPIKDPTRILRATFAREAEDPDAPAHAELRFAVPAEEPAAPAADGSSAATAAERGREHRASDVHWLLAESWWAGSFSTPSYRDLASWSLGIVPWTTISHFATRFRRAIRRLGSREGSRARALLRLLLAGASSLIAVLLFPLLVTLLLLLLIVGALPIPRVRALVADFQRLLSSTLGDSFVLISSPIQEAAIEQRVLRDLQWLIGRGCRRIAVIAHSQGAAVAHSVLQRHGRELFSSPDEADDSQKHGLLFITLGSGLNKVSELRRIRDTNQRWTLWAAPAGLLLFVLALPEAARAIIEDTDLIVPFFMLSLGGMFFLKGMAVAGMENVPAPERLKLEACDRWIDFYSTADPVPNGMLFDSEAKTKDLMEPVEVHNFASAVTDHTSYWRNRDQVVSQAVVALGHQCGLELDRLAPMDRSRLAIAAARRRWRVGWLVATRSVIAALALLLAILSWDDLSQVASVMIDGYNSLARTLPFVGEIERHAADGPATSQAIGLTAMVLLWVGAYLLAYGAWSVWSREDLAAFYRRRDIEPVSNGFLCFLFSTALIVEAAALTMLGHGAGLLPGVVISAFAWSFLLFGLFLAGALVALPVVGLVQLWQLARRLIPALRPTVGQKTKDEPLASEPERQAGRRFWISFACLVLLTVPYATYVTAPLSLETLGIDSWIPSPTWVERLSRLSRDQPISFWPWLLGVLGVVATANALSVCGGFRFLKRRFGAAEHSGPVALAHAALPGCSDPAAVLRERAAALRIEFDLVAGPLRKLREAERDAEVERKLSEQLWLLVVEARQVAARLPEDDAERRDLLKLAETATVPPPESTLPKQVV